VAENEDPPEPEGAGGAAKPQDISSNRAGIVSWIRKIAGDVRGTPEEPPCFGVI